MTRGYIQEHIQEKLVELLSESKTGMSGVEIAQRLGINRATMAKYLNVFAAQGIIKQKNIGNANLWFIESGTEKLQFPSDYFHVKEKFLECLLSNSRHLAYRLIRNCYQSGADVSKTVSEVFIPAIAYVDDLYLKAKIGKSEAKSLHEIISNSIQILTLTQNEFDTKKNIVLLSTESQSTIYARVASCSLGSKGWQVWSLEDMSDAIDILYDLDLQKFLTKIWKQKHGMMVIIVFSATDEGTKFFSESVNSIKPKFGKNLHLAVYSKKTNVKAEFVSDNLEIILQWVDSISNTV